MIAYSSVYAWSDIHNQLKYTPVHYAMVPMTAHSIQQSFPGQQKPTQRGFDPYEGHFARSAHDDPAYGCSCWS